MQNLLNQVKRMSQYHILELVLNVLLCVLLLVLFIGLPLAIYHDHNANKIELTESDWHCTAYRSVAGTIIIGKSIIPTHKQICITWEMNK